MLDDLLGTALGGAFGANYPAYDVRAQWYGGLACPDPMLRNAAAAMNAYRPTPEQEAAWECHRITKEHVEALRAELGESDWAAMIDYARHFVVWSLAMWWICGLVVAFTS